MFQNYLLGATRPVHHFFVIRSNVLYAYSRRHVETVNIFCTITWVGFATSAQDPAIMPVSTPAFAAKALERGLTKLVVMRQEGVRKKKRND